MVIEATIERDDVIGPAAFMQPDTGEVLLPEADDLGADQAVAQAKRVLVKLGDGEIGQPGLGSTSDFAISSAEPLRRSHTWSAPWMMADVSCSRAR